MTRLSRRIQEEAGYACAYCDYPSTSADHVLPRSKGGRTIPANLAACCTRCQLLAGDLDFADLEAKRGYLRAARRPEILRDFQRAERALTGGPWGD